MTRPPAPASAMERRFSARPHVGTVMHVEGLDPAAAVRRLRPLLAAAGLDAEETDEEVRGQRLVHLAAPVAAGEGMELWIVVTERPAVGCTVEVRLYHVIEESALADEYLAALADRLVRGGREPGDGGAGDRDAGSRRMDG